jgi:glutaredoxin
MFESAIIHRPAYQTEATFMTTRQILMVFALFLTMHSVSAVSIMQCEDETGNISFQAHCPPGSKQLNQKEYKTDSAPVTTTELAPLTLYRIPGCDTCDQVKEFLTIRNLVFTEVDISQDVALQDKVKAMAGDLQVPVLAIGDKPIVGYNRTALTQTLTESGHIKASQ